MSAVQSICRLAIATLGVAAFGIEPSFAHNLTRPTDEDLATLLESGTPRYIGEIAWDMTSNGKPAGELRLAFTLLPNGMYQLAGTLTNESKSPPGPAELVAVFAGAAVWADDSTLRLTVFTTEASRGFTPPAAVRRSLRNPAKKLDVAAAVSLTATVASGTLNGTHQLVFSSANAQGEPALNAIRYEDGMLTLQKP